MSISGIRLAASLDPADLKTQSWAQIRIVDESFELHSSGTTEDIEDAFVQGTSSLEPETSAFLLVNVHEGWVACLYVPERAKVRSKTLYSASFEALKQQLGLDIPVSLQGGDAEDFTHHEYRSKVEYTKPGNLTVREQEDRNLHRAEQYEAAAQAASSNGAGVGSAGVGLALGEEASAALTAMAQDSSLTRVLLRVDLKTETIVLVEPAWSGEPCPLTVGDDAPVFAFLRLNGTLFFVYSCPAECKVKAKMVYSSSKGALLAVAAASFGLEPKHKLEVGGVEEVSAGALMEMEVPLNAAAAQAAPIARPGGKVRSRPPRSR
eukprot:TRINITY_DN17092_c0_g1_i1.p1 TRINITY_DN17092_c0_g1~~TRINITY_DN17092_c0_g1_i1.p1  ORF type:complete len:321 (+),score=96.46 TRINITY_DN17092_c0_g1_i1:124-1086(+)